MMETEIRAVHCEGLTTIAGFEDGEWNQEARNAGGPQKQKGKEMNLSQSLRKPSETVLDFGPTILQEN